MRAPKILLILAVLAAGCMLHSAAEAQWSIGAPGTRATPVGSHRFAFLVFANPLPGREDEFNDWYQNVHMGDAVQLPGWTGAQRFRLVKGLTPPGPQDVHNLYDYLIIWDMEGADSDAIHAELNAAISGGKSRRGAAFDYSGAGLSATYQVVAPRVTRPDGKAPFMPVQSDMKTSRPFRYILMDYSTPAAGVKDDAYVASLNRRINQALALPGWMAAQVFRLVPPTGARPGAVVMPKYLVIWETEGSSAQAVQDAFANALKNGSIPPVDADPVTARSVFWQPISPYVTKASFER